MSEENTATVVRAFLEGILSGQVEQAISNYFASDGVVENPLPEPIPFGGIYHGPDGVRQYMARIAETLDIELFEIDEVLAAGDRVVVVGRETSRFKQTGRRYHMDWVHVNRLRDGRIVHMREYNDTAAMLAAIT